MVTQIYSIDLQLIIAKIEIPNPYFYDCIYQFLTGLFHLKFMTNAVVLILTLLISQFWMATFHVPLLMVFTMLSLFGSQECLIIWLTSMLVTNHSLPNFSKTVICIIHLVNFFSKFIVDTTNWSLNTIPDKKKNKIIKKIK